jgi:hypothetical protein
MIRIPREEVEQLKHETDLAALVRASGVELATHGAGGDLIGRCPFHDDRTPSLVVSPAKGAGQPALWHCLGACGVGGSVIDWIMKMRRVGFRHAIEVLREMKSGAGVVGGTAPAPSLLRKRLPPLAGLDAGDRQLMTQVVDYYHQRLKQSPDALAYLQKRGIGSAEAIEQFKIGYADRTLGMRLPQKVTQAGAQIRGRLEKLGLYRQTGREHFNGCVVFPVIDPTTGEVTEVYGRKTIARLRPDLPRHLYLPGGHKGIWNEKALAACEEMILCESIIDALTFWCAGFRNVTCSYGVNGFTPDHLATFKHHGISGQVMEYIEVTPADIEIANKLTHEVLGRSLDELAPQTRRLLVMLQQHVGDECRKQKMLRQDYRFARRDVRAWAGWTDFVVRTHLQKLVDLEYVLTHRGGRGQSFVYELVYGGEGTDGKPFTLGLIDTESLQSHAYDKKFEHQKGEFEHGSSIQSAPIAVGSCAVKSDESPGNHRLKPASSAQPIQITAQAAASDESHHNGASYPLPPLAASSNGNGKVHHGA